MKVAFSHLAVAEKILKEFLLKYNNTPANELLPKIKDYYLDLSDIYLKFGELELVNSNFKKAIEFYEQSLPLKSNYEEIYARSIAEIYYLMGNAYDFDARKALSSFYKAYLILLYHLKKEMKINEIKEPSIQANYFKDEDIKFEEVITKIDGLNDPYKVIELKEIISDVRTKIEDTLEEVKILDVYEKEKEKANNKLDFSDKKYDENQIIDLNKAGIIKKRLREEVPLKKEEIISSNHISNVIANNTNGKINKVPIVSTNDSKIDEESKEKKYVLNINLK